MPLIPFQIAFLIGDMRKPANRSEAYTDRHQLVWFAIEGVISERIIYRHTHPYSSFFHGGGKNFPVPGISFLFFCVFLTGIELRMPSMKHHYKVQIHYDMTGR
jgi:hypothetical protein